MKKSDREIALENIIKEYLRYDGFHTFDCKQGMMRGHLMRVFGGGAKRKMGMTKEEHAAAQEKHSAELKKELDNLPPCSCFVREARALVSVS